MAEKIPKKEEEVVIPPRDFFINPQLSPQKTLIVKQKPRGWGATFLVMKVEYEGVTSIKILKRMRSHPRGQKSHVVFVRCESFLPPENEKLCAMVKEGVSKVLGIEKLDANIKTTNCDNASFFVFYIKR